MGFQVGGITLRILAGLEDEELNLFKD